MRFYGATRTEPGKAVNDDAFACFGNRAILLDGAGNAHGAAKSCVKFLTGLLEENPDMPLNELIGIANQFLLGANQESTLLGFGCRRFIPSYRGLLRLFSALSTARRPS